MVVVGEWMWASELIIAIKRFTALPCYKYLLYHIFEAKTIVRVAHTLEFDHLTSPTGWNHLTYPACQGQLLAVRVEEDASFARP